MYNRIQRGALRSVCCQYLIVWSLMPYRTIPCWHLLTFGASRHHPETSMRWTPTRVICSSSQCAAGGGNLGTWTISLVLDVSPTSWYRLIRYLSSVTHGTASQPYWSLGRVAAGSLDSVIDL
ncbi:hypothetical protein VNO77_28032 [Canavalia gladiata]|uniref:Uncharacterized protein n=1 Tax=Canavalia gladiata TaxID=3824 RepID=A0AAN9QB16_CANGL